MGVSAATGIAGCLNTNETQSYGLIVVNYQSSSQEISVTITRNDTSKTLLNDTYTLGSEERISEEAVFDSAGAYTISANVAGGTSASTDFTVPEDDQLPASSYHIHLTAEGELNLFFPSP
ncbi:hypothetical protein [Halorussus halophilus]|uniref:hypothetical protein n=1 Tax=Halorussus halophilus TaxID=2650975 RepID=UPI001300F367|nr:hypothetical protein [Halorussus halophilus]